MALRQRMRRWASRSLIALCVALLVAHALHMRALLSGHSLDDAYISYRYADNLAHGAGLTFNRGVRVEGYSNFLWVLLLTPLVNIFGDLTVPSQGLGLVCSVASALLALYALRRLFQITHPLVHAGLALFLAGSGYVAAWAVGGLEGSLFGLLVLAAWMRYWIERHALGRSLPLSALLFSAVALIRAEGVLIAGAAAAFHVMQSMRRGDRFAAPTTWLFPAVIVGVVLAYEMWRLAYYGPHLFPNAVRAKTGGGLAQAQRGLWYVTRQFLMPYALLLVPLCLRQSWRQPVFATGLGLFGGYLLFIGVAGGDWTEGRLFAPVLPLGALLFVAWLGTSATITRGAAAKRGRVLLLTAALAYVVSTFVVTSTMREAPYRRDTAERDSERVALGIWLSQNVPSDVVVGVIAAGAIPYYSRLTTHDMYGLNDAHIANLRLSHVGHGAPGHEKFDAAYTLRTVSPDIIIDGRAIPSLIRRGEYRNFYQVVEHFWKYNEVAFHRRLLERMGRASPSPPRPQSPG